MATEASGLVFFWGLLKVTRSFTAFAILDRTVTLMTYAILQKSRFRVSF